MTAAVPAYIPSQPVPKSWGIKPRPKVSKKPSESGGLFNRFIQPFVDALEWNNKTSASSIATRVVSGTSNLFRIFSFIASAISKGNSATESQYPDHVNKIVEIAGISVRYIKIAYVGMVAWSVCDIFKQVMRLKDHTVDAALRITMGLSNAGFAASTMLAGLQDAGLIATKALRFIPVLNIAAAVLSVAECFSYMKAAILHKRNVEVLDTCPKRLSDRRMLLREIRSHKEEGYFEDLYGVSGHTMRKKLRELDRMAKKNIKSKNDVKFSKGKRQYKQMVQNLRQRSKENAYTTQMSMIAALVGTVALVILAVSPLAPIAVVGFAFLALSAGTHIASLIHERISYHKFIVAMRMD